jgi:CheY-like chemotaxis protein
VTQSSSPSVIIIDEERYFASAIQNLLELEGYEVTTYANATDALEAMASQTALPEQLCVLVDMALAPGADQDIFSPAATAKYLVTGLVLVKRLIEFESWRARQGSFVLYTAHFTTEHWSQIIEFTKARRMGSWQKRPDAGSDQILDLVQRTMASSAPPKKAAS